MKDTCVIGIDFGTDSVRALLLNAVTGEKLNATVCAYPRWAKGLYCNPASMKFRQHPLDYLQGMRTVLTDLLSPYPEIAPKVRAIAIDATASTPCLIDSQCTPLALKSGYEENPDAMFVLWKDHTAFKEAKEISELCAVGSSANYACHSGNEYSAECYWAKVLHLLRGNEALQRDAWFAIELCDWIPAVLTGCKEVQKLKLSHCVAELKLMWAKEWGGYPPLSFFAALDSSLPPIVERLHQHNYTCDTVAGFLSAEWAQTLGLSQEVAIGVGNVDSYSGAVGAGICHKTAVFNLGTSACYMAVMPYGEKTKPFIPGIFGQVGDSIVPDRMGYEAGLSAFGDVYAWAKQLLSWPLTELTVAAERLPQRADAPQATDHLNGRRSPSPNGALTGSIIGLSLTTTAPELFYAFVEATAFATKSVLEHLLANGVEVDQLIGIGGISQKSPFVMQMLSDVTGMSIRVSHCQQSCALGAAMFASTIAGVYPSVVDAQCALRPPIVRTYMPNPEKDEIYALRYERYCKLTAFSESLLTN